MKTQLRLASFALLVALCLSVAVVPAMADETLYDNGPYNGQTSAWMIGNGFTVSDSFTLGKAAQIKAISAVFWVNPGDVLESMDWSITTEEFGGVVINESRSNIKNNVASRYERVRLSARSGDDRRFEYQCGCRHLLAEHPERSDRHRRSRVLGRKQRSVHGLAERPGHDRFRIVLHQRRRRERQRPGAKYAHALRLGTGRTGRGHPKAECRIARAFLAGPLGPARSSEGAGERSSCVELTRRCRRPSGDRP